MRVFLLALLCCRSAFAQTPSEPEHREWEVSLFLGSSSGSKFEFPTPVLGTDQELSRTVGIRYDAGPLIGVRVNQNLGDFWAADLEYTLANQRVHFTNLSPSIQSLSLNQFINHISYDVSILPWRRSKRFRPYGDLGTGLVAFYIPGSLKKDVSGLRDSWEFLVNWGGGFKYLVMDEFALTFDMKDRLSQVPTYSLPEVARVVNGQYQPGIARHGVMQTWQFNIGFTFQWDE